MLVAADRATNMTTQKTPNNFISLISDDSDGSDIIFLGPSKGKVHEQGSYVLCFDVGSCNLGFCAAKLEGATFKIIECLLFDISLSSQVASELAHAVSKIVRTVHSQYSNFPIKCIYIERQIFFMGSRGSRFSQAFSKNSRIECALHTAWATLGLKTVAASPPAKTYVELKTLTYYQRKKHSIKLIESWMSENSPMRNRFTDNPVRYVQEVKKKDDICDCILILMSVLMK